MSETVTIKLQGDDYQIAWGESGQATRRYWWDLIAAAGRFGDISDAMAVVLIQNREAIEKLLAEGATAVEVVLDKPETQILNKAQAIRYETVCHECGKKLSEGDAYVYGVDYWTCGNCLKPIVTLTPIPTDPWPAEAVKVWKVMRGEEVLHVWKMPNNSISWRCEGEGGFWSGPAVALPTDWLNDAPILVWERVR